MALPTRVLVHELDVRKPGWVDVERIYGLAWEAFSEANWSEFTERMHALPGATSSGPRGCFFWFNAREDVEDGYLHGSVEPAGFQVYGTLDLTRFESWERTLQSAVGGLPVHLDPFWSLTLLADELREHNWTVEVRGTPREVPEVLEKRYGGRLPGAYLALICGLEECLSPTETAWLVVGNSFEQAPPAFRWDEVERKKSGWAEGDPSRLAQIATFWNHHIPVMMDVMSGDWDVWVLRLDDGVVLHTFGPEWEEAGEVVAESLDEFLGMLVAAGEGPQGAA